MILTSDNRVEVDESINAVVDGLTKYDVARRVSGNQHTYMLVVRRLVLTDAGNYTCQVNVKGYNIQPSKDGIIVVMSESALSYLPSCCCGCSLRKLELRMPIVLAS